MQVVLPGGVTEVWRSPKVLRSRSSHKDPSLWLGRDSHRAPRAGRRRRQSWTNGSLDPSEPWKGRKGPSRGLPGGVRSSLHWRRLHLPVNSRRRKAKPRLRSEKVAGRQGGPAWPSSLPSHLSRHQTRQTGPRGWAEPGEGPPKHPSGRLAGTQPFHPESQCRILDLAV